jgi:hypothetical protein
MAGLTALLSERARGRMLTPASPSTVDLALTLAALRGAPGRLPTAAGELASAVGSADRYVLVLLDGLGDRLLEASLRSDSFLRRHKLLTLTAVAPSGTTAALSTLASGLWPGEHGLLGWWTSLPELGLTATVPTFSDRLTGAPLCGSAAERALFGSPGLRDDGALLDAFFPRALASGAFARFIAGGRRPHPYDGLAGLPAAFLDHTHPARLTFVYVPDLDKRAHRHGTASKETHAVLLEIDALLRDLARRLPASVRLIVTADHGLAEVSEQETVVIDSDDPLLGLLAQPPSGERRFSLFHVRAGREEEFEASLRERLRETHVLLTAADVEGLGLLGPRLSEVVRRRLGSYVAVARDGASLRLASDGRQAASHGGLSPEEMLVPLIVA